MKIIYVFIFCTWLSAFAQFNSTQPNENTPVKFVKVLVHFIKFGDGLNSISENEGRDLAMNIIKNANLQLTNFNPISLKVNGFQVPLLPSKFRLFISPKKGDPEDPEMDGVYFHLLSQTSLSNLQHTLFSQFSKYNDVINIYFAQGYNGWGVASGIGATNLTVGVEFSNKNIDIINIAKGLNHEIGHCLGLDHSWHFDRCDDTAENNNCWGLNLDSPFCNTTDKVTNNMMDYSREHFRPLTPCQLGTIHNYLDLNNKLLATLHELSICESSIGHVLNNSVISQDIIGKSILINGNSYVNLNNVFRIDLLANEISLNSNFTIKPVQNQIFVAKSTIGNCLLFKLNQYESIWNEFHKNYFGVKFENSNQRNEESNSQNIFVCGNQNAIAGQNTNLRNEIEESHLHETKSVKVNMESKPIKFSITPNPCFGECTINNLSSVSYEIEVFNTAGSLVFKSSHANGNSKINLQQSGVFIVKIFAENQVFIHKIINYESD